MKAVILAGGEGTRLRPLTCNTPKVMVPIANVPFLEHFINYLKAYGVTEVILALGHLPDPVGRYFGDGSRHGIRMVYSIENMPLGTSGAVRYAEKYLDEPFLVFNGDIFTAVDLGKMMDLHRSKGARATIALTPVENPTAYGVVETDPDRRVRRFIEKPPAHEVTSNMINAGIYVLDPFVVQRIKPGVASMFERDVFPGLLRDGEPVYSYPSDGYWIDIGTPEKYLKVHHDALLGKAPLRIAGLRREGDILFQGKSQIHPEARLEGPVLIGEGCTIGKGAVVSGGAVLGPRCSVEDGAVLDGAVLWEGVSVGRKALLRRCMVGMSASIENDAWVLDLCVVGDRVSIGPENRLDRGIRVWPDRCLTQKTVTF